MSYIYSNEFFYFEGKCPSWLWKVGGHPKSMHHGQPNIADAEMFFCYRKLLLNKCNKTWEESQCTSQLQIYELKLGVRLQ